MTTYPLSEPATIYAVGDLDAKSTDVLGRGTLSECADLIAEFPAEKRNSVRIQMDDLDLQFDSDEVDELLQFLRDESSGLSNKDISTIPEPDS
ncbi:hypothetical protein U1707_00395 [Sphingomonas sp. PB2P12]|uniref:hypothetical protein n=1 Tax=Sphingomonas sandaracina TaxID=3096157 RepID=UPI002FC89675